MKSTKLKLYEQSEAFLIPSKTDKVMMWIFFALAAAYLVLSAIFVDVIIGSISAFLSIFAAIDAGFPNVAWHLSIRHVTLQRQATFRSFRTNSLENSAKIIPDKAWSISRKVKYWCFGIGALVVFALIFVYAIFFRQ